jgi:uncharacterized membrane protein YeaQ/YmgE (transglycosylase-associated protein family)
MTLLIWIMMGALAGWVASLIIGGRGGLFANIVIGIIGAVTGGIVLSVFGAENAGGFNSGSLLTAVLGSVILLMIVKSSHRPAV